MHPPSYSARRKSIAALALLLCCGAAVAADGEPFLDKAALEKLVVDHKLTFTRHNDNNRVAWDIRRNGMLYGENFTVGSRDTARWTIDDKGQLCLKWKGNSVDACRVFAMRDAKTMMFDPQATEKPAATLESVE